MPSTRLIGIDPARRLDERVIEMVLERRSRWMGVTLAAIRRPGMDNIAVARPDVVLPEINAVRPVAETLAALEPQDPVAQLLRAAVPRS